MSEDSEIGFYTLKQIISGKGKIGILPFSRATLFRMVKRGDFPEPIREFKANVWPKQVVHNWLRRVEHDAWQRR